MAPPDTEPRFRFGRNWRAFLSVLDDEKIAMSEKALCELCGEDAWDGKRFLDIGSGSGLSSLAARRLGAEVVSFDYDRQSVECTEILKETYFPGDGAWSIGRGSVLDDAFLASLGTFDIVYSWGVLHHTGDMHRALQNVCIPVRADGTLVIAIYNDQGKLSRFWRMIKKRYVSNVVARVIILASFIPLFFASGVLSDLKHRRNPLHRYRGRRERGMFPLHDWIDWLGGYPFEVAGRDEVIAFFRARGFEVQHVISADDGLGCNQFRFKRQVQR